MASLMRRPLLTEVPSPSSAKRSMRGQTKELQQEAEKAGLAMRDHRTSIETFKYELKQLENGTEGLHREVLQVLGQSIGGLEDALLRHVERQRAETELMSKQVVETRQHKASLQHELALTQQRAGRLEDLLGTL